MDTRVNPEFACSVHFARGQKLLRPAIHRPPPPEHWQKDLYYCFSIIHAAPPPGHWQKDLYLLPFIISLPRLNLSIDKKELPIKHDWSSFDIAWCDFCLCSFNWSETIPPDRGTQNLIFQMGFVLQSLRALVVDKHFLCDEVKHEFVFHHNQAMTKLWISPWPGNACIHEIGKAFTQDPTSRSSI